MFAQVIDTLLTYVGIAMLIPVLNLLSSEYSVKYAASDSPPNNAPLSLVYVPTTGSRQRRLTTHFEMFLFSQRSKTCASVFLSQQDTPKQSFQGTVMGLSRAFFNVGQASQRHYYRRSSLIGAFSATRFTDAVRAFEKERFSEGCICYLPHRFWRQITNAAF